MIPIFSYSNLLLKYIKILSVISCNKNKYWIFIEKILQSFISIYIIDILTIFWILNRIKIYLIYLIYMIYKIKN